MAALRLPPPSSRRAGQQRTPTEDCYSATGWDTGQNTAFHLTHHQDSVHDVVRMDTGRTTASLSLQGGSVSHSHSRQSEGLMDLLGLAAED
jgi:hypothetical protein